MMMAEVTATVTALAQATALAKMRMTVVEGVTTMVMRGGRVEHSLNLVGITLVSDPPVIKVVDMDRHLYGLRRRTARAASAKKRGGGDI